MEMKGTVIKENNLNRSCWPMSLVFILSSSLVLLCRTVTAKLLPPLDLLFLWSFLWRFLHTVHAIVWIEWLVFSTFVSLISEIVWYYPSVLPALSVRFPDTTPLRKFSPTVNVWLIPTPFCKEYICCQLAIPFYWDCLLSVVYCALPTMRRPSCAVVLAVSKSYECVFVYLVLLYTCDIHSWQYI